MVKKKILVTGANGLLGQKIIYNLKNRTDVSLLACSRGVNRLIETNGYKYIELDITNKNQVQKVISIEKPDAVINCAAMTNVDNVQNKCAETSQIILSFLWVFLKEHTQQILQWLGNPEEMYDSEALEIIKLEVLTSINIH